MSARALIRTKEVRDDGSVIDIVIWQLPEPVAPCLHAYKYRLYFGANGWCRVRYDNERGKGDHRHWGRREEAYSFVSLAQLLADFRQDIALWEHQHEGIH